MEQKKWSSYGRLPWRLWSTNEPTWIDTPPGGCQLWLSERRSEGDELDPPIVWPYSANWLARTATLSVHNHGLGQTIVYPKFGQMEISLDLDRNDVSVSIGLADGYRIVAHGS